MEEDNYTLERERLFNHHLSLFEKISAFNNMGEPINGTVLGGKLDKSKQLLNPILQRLEDEKLIIRETKKGITGKGGRSKYITLTPLSLMLLKKNKESLQIETLSIIELEEVKSLIQIFNDSSSYHVKERAISDIVSTMEDIIQSGYVVNWETQDDLINFIISKIIIMKKFKSSIQNFLLKILKIIFLDFYKNDEITKGLSDILDDIETYKEPNFILSRIFQLDVILLSYHPFIGSEQYDLFLKLLRFCKTKDDETINSFQNPYEKKFMQSFSESLKSQLIKDIYKILSEVESDEKPRILNKVLDIMLGR